MDNKRIISIEGGDGSGKSTIIKMIEKYFIENNIDYMITREPGGVKIAEDIRNIILSTKNIEMDIRTEALLYAASRRQHLSQKVIPLIKDKGHLINISSVAGTFPEREFMAYNVSKAGVTMLTQCLSKRYGDRIFVNSISPGFVDTKLTQENRGILEPTPQHLIDDIPMKRQATPEDLGSD